jgi:protein-S-isoprenylcysteine O-methyltransferase Ste14
MIRITFVVMTVLGVFATGATLIGVLTEKRLEAYGMITALGYLSATIGFLLLVGWTYFKGHLKDVESPKHKVLLAESEDPR